MLPLSQKRVASMLTRPRPIINAHCIVVWHGVDNHKGKALREAICAYPPSSYTPHASYQSSKGGISLQASRGTDALSGVDASLDAWHPGQVMPKTLKSCTVDWATFLISWGGACGGRIQACLSVDKMCLMGSLQLLGDVSPDIHSSPYFPNKANIISMQIGRGVCNIGHQRRDAWLQPWLATKAFGEHTIRSDRATAEPIERINVAVTCAHRTRINRLDLAKSQ